MAEAVVLARKIYVAGDARERTLRSLRGQIGNHLSDLDASFEIELREDGFPIVTLEGEDAVVARNLLAETFDEIPTSADGASGDGEQEATGPFDPEETYTGTLESWDENGFVLDAGVPVRVPPSEIELGPGNPEQIVERFGLVQHLPMQFQVTGERWEGDADGPFVAALADAERDRLYEWQRGPGRVTVNSATRSEVRATVNRAGHAQDIVTVERLGLLEQSIVCTEDTDPPGLIASIGEYLPAELRAVV
ncbi:hypothetical protein L593_09510 [Salinarchaeum sp. Harcht-Bsk1]|uniref:DUF2110 family protein n=1 Tax=Salinarchaeum sp. Harcht-Bsk1 TaxID=1333523 RepID=UPI0003423C5C|nr:DUF2110 family protein [Salinarchaeum sp. Harcht-Bsk1]AGN01847.1 hypothetical protein L593_09510 [Salinarchaeum sp. Harcht-Bsk1]